MSETKSKTSDVSLKGVKLDSERAGKIDIVLKGVKDLRDRADRLTQRVDAFEGSKDKDWFKNDARRK